jgi:hypothetical protein
VGDVVENPNAGRDVIEVNAPTSFDIFIIIFSGCCWFL